MKIIALHYKDNNLFLWQEITPLCVASELFFKLGFLITEINYVCKNPTLKILYNMSSEILLNIGICSSHL